MHIAAVVAECVLKDRKEPITEGENKGFGIISFVLFELLNFESLCRILFRTRYPLPP